jgi:hypothetical protein
MPPRAATARGLWSLMDYVSRAPTDRVPSPGIDSEQFEAEQAALRADEEAKQLKSEETEEDAETEQARAVRARCNEEEIEEVWFDDIGHAQIRFENDTTPSGRMEGRVFVIDPCAAEAEQAPEASRGAFIPRSEAEQAPEAKPKKQPEEQTEVVVEAAPEPKYEPMDEDECEAPKEETPKGRGRGKGAGKDKGRLEQPPIRILAARGGGEGAERHTRTLENFGLYP